MYEAHFGLNRRPFPPVPDANYYFPAEAIEAARRNLLRCLERGEGTGLVIGRSGTGKTLLCQVLGEQLRPRLAVVHLCSGRLSSRSALYQAILHGLECPYRGMEEGELRLALVDRLTNCEDGRDGLAILIDEAHTMPLRLLDEIRMLTNLASSGQPRVRVLLAGDPVLEERFASPKLESFSQRLVARCYLEAFHRVETQEYIRAQINAADGDASRIFPMEAATAVHQATEGVPRLVNQLCDHALVLAYADGDSSVDVARIEAAWADLQQMPAPWTGDAPAGESPNVIEFGGLEDDSLPRDESVSMEPAAAWLSAEEDSDIQVDRLEHAFSALEDRPAASDKSDRFRPAGVIGPEAELAFDEPRGPFAEPFVEEEEIVQPYRATAAPGRPELTTKLPPVEELREESSATERPARGVRAAETWAATVLTETTADSAIPTGKPRRVPLRELRDAPEAIKDLIVVQEEDELADLAVAPPTVVGRRKQYGRLFAKLRHE
jgi:type II secretory pathway predicted ATPase ExeA